MPFIQKGNNEDVETLVDSLTNLNDANLTNLTTSDIQQLAELTQEIDTDEQEVIIQTVDESDVVEEVMQTDIGAQEIEIETERPQSPEEILPDVKIKTTLSSSSSSRNITSTSSIVVATTGTTITSGTLLGTTISSSSSSTTTTTSLPPLRPLTIAPKPTKVPIAMKPVPGQQLLLLQGGTSNQAIKLVSTQGQELNLANIQIGRPVAIKPAMKSITTTNQQSGNISLVQPKQVVMKKIVTTTTPKTITKPIQTITTTNKPNTIMVMQKSDHVKILPNQTINATTLQQTPTKTITLQQAQELGLITTATATKFLTPQGQSTPKKQTVLLNKSIATSAGITTTTTGTKTIKIVPHITTINNNNNNNYKNISGNNIQPNKTPMKILPATNLQTTSTLTTAAAITTTTTTTTTSNKIPQRIIFKTTGSTGGQTILPTAQIIQVTGTQALSTGQLHQINIPGKGMQYIKFVTATNADNVVSSVSTLTQAKSSIQNSFSATPTNIVLSEIKPITTATIGSRPLKNIAAKTTVTTPSQVVMVPNLVTQPHIELKTTSQQQTNQLLTSPTLISRQQQSKLDTTTLSSSSSSSQQEQTDLSVNLESNGIRPRKPCNCTKSQCLKLYCDCFANGEFCFMCNCMNCFNNLENEYHRQRAIKTCLERNPNAFRPKIGKAKDVSGDASIRKHTKGCNCKRSGCLKNYCECYEAKIACSNNCKCIGCRNFEDSIEKKSLHNTNDDGPYLPQLSHKISTKDITQFRTKRSSNTKLAINFITDEVIEAMSQCMLTISHSAENEMQDEEVTKRQIIEEFGRCLTEIINYSSSHN